MPIIKFNTNFIIQLYFFYRYIILLYKARNFKNRLRIEAHVI